MPSAFGRFFSSTIQTADRSVALTKPPSEDGSEMDLVFVSPTVDGIPESTGEVSSGGGDKSDVSVNEEKESDDAPAPYEMKVSKIDDEAEKGSTKDENSELDLVFVVDNTGSMGSWILSAQQNIQCIIRDIVASEASNVRFGLVSYRDHPPQDTSFVTKTHDFTENVQDMQRWVDGMRAQGGGDAPEAVADGLFDCLNLSYRPNSTKVAVLIADAPPHGLGCYADGFPNGCPHGHDPLQIVREMAARGITIYSVICGNFEGQGFYQGIAQMTGGQYIPISSAHLLAGVIVGGAQEEITLERLMKDAQEMVEAEERAAQRELNDDELASKLEGMFKERGTRGGTRRTLFSGSSLPDYEATANFYSTAKTMAEVRTIGGGRKAHLARGTYGGGIDSAPAPTAAPHRFEAERSDEVSYEQCKRMARKSKARGSRGWGTV
eukprot:CAMPEP_0113554894 /NCGR_PEP_ID=MMETSP0015_2-20120614/16409_1 /TAXON_ID=2838 /ORGANISM="Odontella" /LENGTH=435 /DNA_ID=CAMNT_0000456099 /DNA_START=137 /DNA_END=1444 /DNA_ORIENTATION=+ /assembly_acc=CAM_ASM_000160